MSPPADLPPQTQAWIEKQARAMGCTCGPTDTDWTPTPSGWLIQLLHTDLCPAWLEANAPWN